MFQIKKAITFQRAVTVEFPDGSTGTLQAEFRTIPQDELEGVMGESDSVLVDRVLVSPGPIGGENGQPLEVEAARAAVLGDTCCVAALAAEYLSATKTVNFRRKQPGGRR